MGISKTIAGHRYKRTTSHQAKKSTTIQSPHHYNLSATKHARRFWTREQLSDANYLKVPISVWNNIQKPIRTEWLDGAEDTLRPALATGTLLPTPNIGPVGVHKWFCDRSIESTGGRDTYRYRVIDQATDFTILPEDEWQHPVEDETKIKILFPGPGFKDHSEYNPQTSTTKSTSGKKRLRLQYLQSFLLLRRVCPDADMKPVQSADEWRQYLPPSIQDAFSQVRTSTTSGWPTQRQPQEESELPAHDLASVQEVGPFEASPGKGALY